MFFIYYSFFLACSCSLTRLSLEMPIKLAYYRHPVARLARPIVLIMPPNLNNASKSVLSHVFSYLVELCQLDDSSSMLQRLNV